MYSCFYKYTKICEFQRLMSFFDFDPGLSFFDDLKQLLKRHWPYCNQIPYTASKGRANENLSKRSMSHGQYCRHNHLWYKTFKIFFSRTNLPISLKLGICLCILENYQYFTNDDLYMTSAFFMARSSMEK